MSVARSVRQTLTVARRDFVATVYTPTFLLFLLAPVIMLSFGLIGGLGAANMSESGEHRMRIVAAVPGNEAASLIASDSQLRALWSRRDDDRPVELEIVAPRPDVAGQARALFAAEDREVLAVLYGPLERPQILHIKQAKRSAAYLAALADRAVLVQRAGGTPVSRPTMTEIERGQASFSGKGQAAFLSVFGLFFLTLMLAGQAVGTMAEERSNKVIEVLAAAVPLESVFLGKLIGMFGVAVLFIAFWGTLVTNLAQLVPGNLAAAFADLRPAVGGSTFALLFMAYFTMSYMLFGGVFLAVGAQAGTQRELQMLSLPITVVQVGFFGWASAAGASPDSWVATGAEIFPFSSPYAMVARAANSPELWRHGLALAWQLLWVAIVVSVGARWFRRGVLKSGSPKLRLPKLRGR